MILNDLDIGKNIEFLINFKNIQKQKIAEMVGVTRQQLRHISLSKDVNTSMLRKLAFVLNVNLIDFLLDIEQLKAKYNHNNKIENTPSELVNNNNEIVEIQFNALKIEIALMKDLLKSKDELIKLLSTNKSI